MSSRPRPVRVFVAVLTGINAVFLSVLPMLESFEVINWTAQQMGLVEAAIGTGVTAIGGVVAAVSGNGGVLGAIQGRVHITPVEAKVTPVSDPRDDQLVPLVPIANDALEDEDVV